MNELSKHCLKSKKCDKSGLSQQVLNSIGCTSYDDCNEFLEKGEKIKDKVIIIKASCSKEKCIRDSRKRCKSDCIDCRELNTNESGKTTNLEIHSRCVNQYCYKGKKNLDNDCLDCIECKVFNIDKNAWTFYRGGKDINGRNL